MLKKTISYEDYNGLQRTEDFYFNLSKAELTEKQLTTKGGYSEMLEAIVAEKDQAQIILMFKELILIAFGQKSEDGRRFEKSKELSTWFAQTEAYSELFMDLATNADHAADFVNGIIPSGASKLALA